MTNDEWGSGRFDSSFVTRLSVVVTEGGFEREGVLESDQFPSDPVLVPSVFRTGEKSHDCMEADELEKLRLLNFFQKCDLLFGRQFGETPPISRFFLELFQPFQVGLLLVLVESRESAIDEENNACLPCAGCRVRRQDLSGDGLYLCRLFGREKLQFHLGARCCCPVR